MRLAWSVREPSLPEFEAGLECGETWVLPECEAGWSVGNLSHSEV